MDHQTGAQRQRVRFGKEEQGSVRSFRRQAETELSGLCDDAVMLDNALAMVDNVVAMKLGL